MTLTKNAPMELLGQNLDVRFEPDSPSIDTIPRTVTGGNWEARNNIDLPAFTTDTATLFANGSDSTEIEFDQPVFAFPAATIDAAVVRDGVNKQVDIEAFLMLPACRQGSTATQQDPFSWQELEDEGKDFVENASRHLW